MTEYKGNKFWLTSRYQGDFINISIKRQEVTRESLQNRKNAYFDNEQIAKNFAKEYKEMLKSLCQKYDLSIAKDMDNDWTNDTPIKK